MFPLALDTIKKHDKSLVFLHILSSRLRKQPWPWKPTTTKLDKLKNDFSPFSDLEARRICLECGFANVFKHLPSTHNDKRSLTLIDKCCYRKP